MSSTTTDGSLAARGCPKSDILGRQPRRTDVVPDISFPLSLKEGGPHQKQYRYRLAVSERHRCVKATFIFADLNLTFSYFLQVHRRPIAKGIHIGLCVNKCLKHASVLSHTNAANWAFPMLKASFKLLAKIAYMT